AREIFAAVTIERSTGEAVLLVSHEGGSSIEAKAAEDPSLVQRFSLSLPARQGEPGGDFLGAAKAAGVEGELAGRAAEVFRQMARIVVDLD
ncbi:ATP-grasp domain-containing protein, partial [Acinetobacter baumannii]